MLTKHTQQTKISTRIRIETDSYVRVVGETVNGKLFMSAVPIRASGGCSGYMDSGDPELTKDLGKILFKRKVSIRQPELNILCLQDYKKIQLTAGLYLNGQSEQLPGLAMMRLCYKQKLIFQLVKIHMLSLHMMEKLLVFTQ